jgi:thiamine-monophosphate kinase
MREDDLTAAIASLVRRKESRVHLGIGDDAAVWQPSRSNRSVITTDALIENVHFSLAYMSLTDVGWRSMAANVSDIAAMGARAVLATIALGVPPGANESHVLSLYEGLDACARLAGCEIVGGDLTSASSWTIAVTVVGEVRAANLKTRSGAKSGDVVAVTGPLGSSRAGLEMLRGEIALPDALAKEAAAAHRRPTPRLREGAWLGASRSVRALMDCSDGLSTDLTRLARASGARVRVTDVPASASACAAADALHVDAEAFALGAGEDFELLISVAKNAFPHLSMRFAKHFGRPLLRVGTVEAGEGVVMVKQGAVESLTPNGWEHFQ